MNVRDKIKSDPEAVKKYIEQGYSPEWAESQALSDLIADEFFTYPAAAAFHHWLKYIWNRRYDDGLHGNPPDPSGPPNDAATNPELWAAWQAAKPSYDPERVDAECAAAKAARAAAGSAAWQAERAAKLAADAEKAKRDAAERARCDAIVARLQASVIKPVELNPVNWQELHKLKKHPNKAKRDLAQRWSERFEALPDNVQHAWQAFYGSVTIMSPATDDPVDDVDESDDDAEQTPAPTADAQIIHLTPYPSGKRDIHDGNADVVQAGVRDPAFRAFIPFSEGVRRLFDLIGNPIDEVILPPHDPYQPEPAQAVDDIADDGDVDDIVPGLIPRDGLTVAHGDSKHGKSLFMQKLAIVIADGSGAKFEGIEVEHGQVIYATLDPGAEAKRIKPGVLEIRDRLGLQPSGRLHLTNAALILNEPASVADWIELNKARLPCKLIVVDSLFSAVAAERSLITDTVVRGAMDGVRMLLRHADAVVLVHHDNKGGDIFGSVFLNAMMVSKAAVVRDVHRDGRLGDHVTVTVEFLKFASAELKLAYRLDGPFLGPADSADSGRADKGPVKRPDLLELLGPTPTPRGAARALIVAKLRGKPEARGKQWLRLLEHWIERGAVIDDGDTIRRVI